MTIESAGLQPWSVAPALSAMLALSGMAGCGTAPAPVAGPTPAQVSIGYGTLDRGSETGAISSINGDELRGGRVRGIQELLETRVPGLSVMRRPDGELSLRIRGAAQSGSRGEPLVVIDGFPILSGRLMSAFASINPLLVLRVDVLKDAGSTAAYGSRGANGVILITTRRGS